MFRYYGAFGLSLIVVSYFLRTLPDSYLPVTETFVIGYWLFFDALDFRLSGTSILHKIKSRHSFLLYCLLAGLLIGIVFDFFGAYLSRLWTYPDFSVLFYAKGVLFGYGFPMLMYYSAYRVVLHMLKHEFGSFGRKLAAPKEERRFFSLVVYLGIAATGIPLAFMPFSLSPVPRGLLFGFTLIGIWFILEGVEYRQHKRSLLKDMFEGYWNPLVAIIIAAFITGISWEFLNTIDYSWRYTNLPLSGVQIAGVPVAVIAGWVPLFVVYLSFYRAVFRREKIF